MRSTTTMLATLTALALLTVPAVAADGSGASAGSSAEEASASQCRDDRGRQRSPSDCRILEQFERRREAQEEAERERLEASCGRDPSQPACAAACDRSANEVAESEAALKRSQKRLTKSKRRLAAARRAQRQATTQRAKRRAAAVKARRADAVRENKRVVRVTKAELRERRGEKPSFCG